MRAIAIVVCVCVAATGTGCVSAEGVARRQHGRVHAGLAQAEVQSRLGPPSHTATDNGVDVWTYVYTEHVSPLVMVLAVVLVAVMFVLLVAARGGGGNLGGNLGGPPHQFKVGFGSSGRVAWVGCVHPAGK